MTQGECRVVREAGATASMGAAAYQGRNMNYFSISDEDGWVC